MSVADSQALGRRAEAMLTELGAISLQVIILLSEGNWI